MPIISQRLACLGQAGEIEREFFRSLSHLASLYGFAVPDMSTVAYPFNIAQAFEHARQQMKTIRPDMQLIILKDEHHKSCIATIKVFDIGGWLYYIPVKPLHLLLNGSNTKPQAQLLLSAFSYLYQIARIPYFTEGYLGDTYDAIQSWYEEDPTAFDEVEYLQTKEELKVMEYTGRRTLKSMKHPYHLQQFEKRLNSFQPVTSNDEHLLHICTKLFDLYKQYPSKTIFDNIEEGLLDPSEEERISLYQYVSFFWSGEGTIYQQVMETVNVQFQEIPCMEEPLTVQFFDIPQQEETHDLDFEQNLFGYIHELNEYLNEI